MKLKGCLVLGYQLLNLAILHKNIIVQSMIGAIDLSGFLDDVELVMVRGGHHKNGRKLDYDWIFNTQGAS